MSAPAPELLLQALSLHLGVCIVSAEGRCFLLMRAHVLTLLSALECPAHRPVLEFTCETLLAQELKG
jgi:hypothetical protein